MTKDIAQYFAEGCGRCPLGGTPDCKVHSWEKELQALRRMTLDCGLTEEVKWGVPCYTYQNANVVLVSAFKDHCAISFFKGSLLSNEQGLLTKPGEHSQAARLLKFTSLEEIISSEQVIKANLFESIEVEKTGRTVPFKRDPEPIPEELALAFENDPTVQAAFEALTPGRQRGYLIHFTQPKQSKTRTARIEKWIPRILNGEGMHDQYQAIKIGRK